MLTYYAIPPCYHLRLCKLFAAALFFCILYVYAKNGRMVSIALAEPKPSAQFSTVPSQARDSGSDAASTVPQSPLENSDWTQITLRISKKDLAEINASAQRLRITRAALFRAAALKYIRNKKPT